MVEGDAFVWVADEAGTVEYLCSYHPLMKGVIEVRDP